MAQKLAPSRWPSVLSPSVRAIVVLITARLWHKSLTRYQGVGH